MNPMTPQTAAALRALVTDIRERANRPVNDSIAHIAYNWCADSIEIVAKQLAAQSTISELADRFLGWPLPESVNPDLCVHTKGEERAHYRPIGTHLLTHSEACAMLEYVLKPDGRGKTPAQCPKHESANNAGVATGSRNDSARESDPGRPSDLTELAAVLTQEGEAPAEDLCDWHGQRQRQHSWVDCDGGGRRCIHCKREEHAAPAAPRAAEGAGTVRMMKDSNGDIHEECPDCRGECTPVECDTKPTAAAAVPAGGDAVAWRYWVSDTNHSVWHDMPVDQENRADCEELGYQVQYAYTVPAPRGGVTEALPAIERDESYDRDYIPIGACYEVQTKGHGSSFRIAHKDERNVGRINIQGSGHEFAYLEKMARAIHAERSTPPAAQAHDATAYMAESVGSRHLCFSLDDAQLFARDPSSTITPLVPAQAQDAEPMAMHLREAFQEWRAGAIDSLRLNDAWDVIWNRARALAAKEAK